MPTTPCTSFDSATWLLLLNPISGGGLGLRDRLGIESAIAAHGLRHVSALSEYPGHVVTLVAEAIGRGCRRILIAGGDGSLGEAVNGIFLQQGVAPEQVRLALLPIGTEYPQSTPLMPAWLSVKSSPPFSTRSTWGRVGAAPERAESVTRAIMPNMQPPSVLSLDSTMC